jgi:protein-tyrosine phosphatase
MLSRGAGTVAAMTATEHRWQHRLLELTAPTEDPYAPPEPLPERADPPSEILRDALWQGGAPVDFGWVTSNRVNVVADLGDADTIATPRDIAGVAYLKHPIEDGELPDLVVLDGLVSTLAAAIREGRRTLVHCGWGRNRSGLVVALLLRELLGVDGRAAVLAVRERRHRALNNQVFADYLESLPAPS